MYTNESESVAECQGVSKYDCKDCDEQRSAQQRYKKGCLESQRVFVGRKRDCGFLKRALGVYIRHFGEFGSHVGMETSFKAMLITVHSCFPAR